MVVLPVGEHALDVPVERPHDPDLRQHRRAAFFDNQHQGADRRLPLGCAVFCFRQLGDVVPGVAQRLELTAIGQRYRVFEFSGPALFRHDAYR